MEIRKSEFLDWKNSLVTQVMAQSVAELAQEMIADLVMKRESNPADDQWVKGFLQGVQAIMDWEPEFVQEESTDA